MKDYQRKCNDRFPFVIILIVDMYSYCFYWNFSGKLEFDTFSSVDVRKLSHLQVSHRDMYQGSVSKPYPHGPLDQRLGTSTKSAICETCGEGAVTCVGHFGYVDFCVPVFHFGFFKTTHFTLQIICKVNIHFIFIIQ